MLQLTRGAWLFELVYGPHPLREKLALTWSNHFVIGTDKVRNVHALAGYLGLLRRHAATTSFERFTLEVAQAPAMLRYLDNDQNRRGNRTRISAGNCWNCSRPASGSTPRTTCARARAP